MAQSHFSLNWESYETNICTGLSSLQHNGEFVDMSLAADGHVVKVHQVVMALSSPYLKELISSVPCQHPVIFLNEMGRKSELYYQGKIKGKKKKVEKTRKARAVLRELNRQKSTENQILPGTSSMSEKCPSDTSYTIKHSPGSLLGEKGEIRDEKENKSPGSSGTWSLTKRNKTTENLDSIHQTSLPVNFDCIDDPLEDLVMELDKSPPPTPIPIEGRRLIDYQFFFDQLVEISQHSIKFGCQMSYLKTIEEKRHGFSSKFTLRCSMCESIFYLNACNEEESGMDINHSAVSGIIMTGCGRANLNELASSMNLPTMNNNIYSKCHKNLRDWWKSTAEHTMKEAAAEERVLATEKTPTGIPKIPVTADASWCKRSYRTNYSSLAGVGAIIGVNSGKVLHIGVKNKYCIICMRAINKKQDPPEHHCNANHKGSSTSMEQAAIVDGFKQSVDVHNLMYSKLIADGDASTYKNILESRPYPNITVEKIECSNHLLRNYNGKNLNLTKDTSIPIGERKLLNSDRLKRLRIAVKSAVRYRTAQNLPLAVKIKNLQNDILNSPKHIFGEHTSCEDYFCTTEKKLEPNNVPKIKTLMQKLNVNASSLAYHARSLLYNLNNNRAEQFNAIVAKYIGGKRINYALKDSYELRCYAAVVAYNTGTPIYTLHKTIFNKSPSATVKNFEQQKLVQNTRTKKTIPKKQLLFNAENTDYGQACQKPDMPSEEFDTAKELFLENLKQQLQDRHEIERDTIFQAESALWLELRRCLLTASNFSKVCKRRENLSSAPLVKNMLYSYSISHVPSIQHGKTNESIALEQLAKQENIVIQKCGLHIDEKYFFLGATPDALFDGGIIEIKCPLSSFGMNADDAIRAKKIKFWSVQNEKTIINMKHDWFFQIQGQLHITKKPLCLFAVWTGTDQPLKVEKILKNDDFWANKMENKLKTFYMTCLLPEIVDSRKARSMHIRNTSY